MVINNQLEPILGIFKQLVEKKANEIYAFELLECILSYFPPYGPQLVTLLKHILTTVTEKSYTTTTPLSCKCFS